MTLGKHRRCEHCGCYEGVAVADRFTQVADARQVKEPSGDLVWMVKVPDSGTYEFRWVRETVR